MKRKYCGIIFLACLVVFLFVHGILPDKNISIEERRHLAKAPAFGWDNFVSGTFQEDLEEYLLDQFPFRQAFRSIKANMQYFVWGQKDNNGIYVVDGSISKVEYPLKESMVTKAANYMQALQSDYFPEAEVYYALVPDKNYFLAEANGYPSLDYERLQQLMKENLNDMNCIDLFSLLDIEDYYRTDSHWKQECIVPVAQEVAKVLGVYEDISWDYEQSFIEGFYGVYFGQAALGGKGETITYLSNEKMDAVQVFNFETQKTTGMYQPEKIADASSVDFYDVYLGGAAALLELENPSASNAKKLIVFRDSFGSSLVPLLAEGYQYITVIDTRYISAAMLGKFVDFSKAQVLFLYSTSMINSSAGWK